MRFPLEVRFFGYALGVRGERFRPIRATTAPVTTGGISRSIHLEPYFMVAAAARA